MTFVLPDKASVGYLDPEIAGEGERVLLSNGDEVNWTPPPVKPVMPDMSQIKSIRHYFGRTGYAVYPAWIYHPTEPARVVKNAEEAGKLGVMYRKATQDESSRYGVKAVWDYADDSKWRPAPWTEAKFDPANPGSGKTFISGTPNPAIAQHALVEALIPQVAAAVALAMKQSGAAAAPSNIDPAQWDAFMQFQAWQKSSEAVQEAVASTPIASSDDDDGFVEEASDPVAAEEPPNGLALTAEQERTLYEDEAVAKGIKVDGRWSLDRLKSEVEKAAA